MPDRAILLCDTPASRQNLYPLSLTRPLAELQRGMLSVAQWWNIRTGLPVFALTEEYLQQSLPQAGSWICVDSSLCPDETCMDLLKTLQAGQVVADDQGWLGHCATHPPAYGAVPFVGEDCLLVKRQQRIDHAIMLLRTNETAIAEDFALVTQGRFSASPSTTNQVLGDSLFLEEGVTMECAVINTRTGPVYIGKNALIMEGACIRGPVFIGAGAVVKMGARVYAGTSVGAGSVIGGEVKNSLIFPFSNKAHDGYLGDSVIGSWCNLGAGTSNSNLKNTAGMVQTWHQGIGGWINAGHKCGTVMGDYSRTAINTSLNTGTTVGVCCSIHGAGIPGKRVASFTWGDGGKYCLEKAIADVANWKVLKHQILTADDARILRHIYHHESV